MPETIKIEMHFNRPPVIETRIGVQFAPLIGFRSGHFGLFWKECLGTEDWQILTDQPASPREVERFGSKLLRPTVENDEGDFAQVCMKLSSQNGRTVHFQPNKIVIGWNRAAGRPAFSEVQAEFAAIFSRMEQFSAKWNLGRLVANLWEITYVNKILPGSLWQTPADWHKVLPGVFPPGGPTVTGLNWSTFNGTWFFEIPPQKGRVRMRVQKVVETQTQEILLLLVITARGEIGEPGVSDWMSGIDLGHQSASRLFDDVTSPEAQEEWRKHEH